MEIYNLEKGLRALLPRLIVSLFSFGVFLWLMGVDSLNPFAFTLFAGQDVAQHFFGWFFFLKGGWLFPVGTLPNFIYPVGTSLAYSDTFPLFAALGKLLSFNKNRPLDLLSLPWLPQRGFISGPG